MKSDIRFSAIDHITLVVADLEVTRNFYCNILGMQQVPRPDFDFAGLWLHDCQPADGANVSAMIHVILESESSGQAGWGDRGSIRLSRGHHFAFQIDDAHAACQYLRSAGIEIAVGPDIRPDGPTKFCVQDPDGHVIEFFSQPPR